MLHQNRERLLKRIVVILAITLGLISYAYVTERNWYHEKLTNTENELDTLQEMLIDTEASHQAALSELLTQEEQIEWFQKSLFRSEYILWGMDTIKLMWCHDQQITSDADRFLRQIIDYALEQPEDIRAYLTSHPDWPAIFDVPFADEFTGHTDFVRSVAFSPDDQILATGSADRTARLWDIRSGRALYLLYGHKDWVTDVVFNPQGDRLITTSRDFTSRIWDTRTGKLLHILEGQQGRPLAASVSPNGQFVATAADDGSIHIWSIADGQLITQFKQEDTDFTVIAFAPDNRRIAVGTAGGRIYIWQDDSGILPSSKSQYYSKALDRGDGGYGTNDINFFSDGQHIVSLHSGERISIRNIETAEVIRRIDPARSWMHSLKMSPDEQSLVTTQASPVVGLWDLQTGKLIYETQAHTESAWDAAFSHDGRLIASVGDDHKARVWIANIDDLLTAGRLIHLYEYKVRNDKTLTSASVLSDWCGGTIDF